VTAVTAAAVCKLVRRHQGLTLSRVLVVALGVSRGASICVSVAGAGVSAGERGRAKKNFLHRVDWQTRPCGGGKVSQTAPQKNAAHHVRYAMGKFPERRRMQYLRGMAV